MPAPDDGNDRFDLSLPSVDWGSPAASAAVGAIVVCYDNDTVTGDETNLIPLTMFPVTLTPDGNPLTLNSGIFYRAS